MQSSSAEIGEADCINYTNDNNSTNFRNGSY